MTRANAPLTPAARPRLAKLIIDDAWSRARAAERFEVSASTAHKWSHRYRDGQPTSKLATSPNQTPQCTERRIIRLRHTRRWSPAPIAYRLEMASSTAHRLLRRYRMPAMIYLDQATGLPVRRAPANNYVHDVPGDIVHMNVKKLGRITDGGGWRNRGRGDDKTKNHSGIGYACLHRVVDG